MRIPCGPLMLNCPNPGEEGRAVAGHCHNFDHVTFVHFGIYEIGLLKNVELDMEGRIVKGEIEETALIDADSDTPYFMVRAGCWHILIPKTPRARYICAYPHLLQQAITFPPGQRIRPPWTKRDEDGVLWVRIDETIVESHASLPQSWIDTYSG